jgi:hypothetical protein
VHDIDNETIQKRLGAGFANRLGDVMAAAEAANMPPLEPTMKADTPEEEL